ncbi:hypothetical protein TNIN_293861 [Trichonephila inaurata madagascariensis]|uniref:Uncharacterized protein n=1 Tax=Trichonephila inaurata madagascariensis TaxID=2747483 RepID=A0A8X6XFX1_9ARAC|nr:hypothetical protein TNIN_293861 [Trichonephila inaurata madagascariensis]
MQSSENAFNTTEKGAGREVGGRRKSRQDVERRDAFWRSTSCALREEHRAAGSYGKAGGGRALSWQPYPDYANTPPLPAHMERRTYTTAPPLTDLRFDAWTTN